MKTLTLDLKLKLPNGQLVALATHSINVSGLEAYACEALISATGGNFDLTAGAILTEASA